MGGQYLLVVDLFVGRKPVAVLVDGQILEKAESGLAETWEGRLLVRRGFIQCRFIYSLAV